MAGFNGIDAAHRDAVPRLGLSFLAQNLQSIAVSWDIGTRE